MIFENDSIPEKFAESTEGQKPGEMSIDSEEGLSDAEAQTRLARAGFNEIREEPAGLLHGILKRLWGPIPWMLEAALVFEVALGKVAGPALIAVWLLFSAILGGIQERRARNALDLLRSRLEACAFG